MSQGYGEHIADLAGYGVGSGELRDYEDAHDCPVCGEHFACCICTEDDAEVETKPFTSQFRANSGDIWRGC